MGTSEMKTIQVPADLADALEAIMQVSDISLRAVHGEWDEIEKPRTLMDDPPVFREMIPAGYGTVEIVLTARRKPTTAESDPPIPPSTGAAADGPAPPHAAQS